MRRKLILLAACACLVFSFTACSRESGYTLMSLRQDTLTSMKMSYQKFSGYKEKDISVPDNEVLVLSGEFTTNSGTLGITVSDAEGNLVFEKKDVQNSDFETELAQGSYEIRIDADDHSGSYYVSWTLNKEKP